MLSCLRIKSFFFLLGLLAFNFLFAQQGFTQETVARVPLKGIYKTFRSFNLGDSVLILCKYDNIVRKRKAGEGVLQSAVIISSNGTKIFLQLPDTLSDKTVAVTRNTRGIYFHTVIGKREPCLKTLFYDYSQGNLAIIASEPISPNILAFHGDRDLKIVTYEKKRNAIELLRVKQGVILEKKKFPLPDEFSSMKIPYNAVIWDEHEPTLPQAGSPSKIYILKDEIVVTYDRVTNGNKDFTLVFRQDEETKKASTFRISNQTGSQFRTTWYNGKLYSVSRNKTGFYVSIYDQEKLEKTFAVTSKSYADMPAFPEKSATIADAIRTYGPPFITVQIENSNQSILKVGAQLVEKKSPGMIVATEGLFFITALASGILHAVSDEVYVSPTYFYMEGSVGSEFKMVSESSLVGYRIDLYEKKSLDFPIRYSNKLKKDAEAFVVYVTDRPYEVIVVKF